MTSWARTWRVLSWRAVIAPTPRATIAHLVLAAALLAVCATASERDRVASATTVEPGQRAVVHTVFRGAAIDSFEAVIVGTLASGRTQGDMILARATSESVIQSGIAQGMSGSPVYVGGRLIGALSSGWAFNREPLFGITPLGEMLELWNRPASDTTDTDSSGPSGADEGGTARLPRWDLLRWSGDDAGDDAATLAQVAASTAPASAPTSTGLTRLALPLACGGLDPRLMELARRWFEPLGLTAVPGGVAKAKSSGAKPASRPPSHAGPAALEPGSAVAVEVLRGDLQFAAIGTVTWRDGDRVLLFGHPFFQSGTVRMPMATADIVTVVSSNQMSFKLGQRVDEVGAVTEDRRAGVAGLLGAKVEMLPLTVDVRGTTPQPQQFHFESIEDRNLAPTLLAIAAANGLLESGGTGSSQTVRWRIRLRRSGLPPLELRDVTVSESPATDVAAALASPLRFLYGNPFAPLDLDSVSIALDVEPGRESWTLRSARLLDPTVRPGGTARIACDIERWRGGTETRVLSVTVPPEAPEGRYVVWTGGSGELDRYEAARLPGRFRATSLDDAWRRLANRRTSDALYASLYARAPEMSREGRDYPELPASALPLLGMAGSLSGSSGDATTDKSRPSDLAILDEVRQPLDGALRGEIVLQLSVETHTPVAAP